MQGCRIGSTIQDQTGRDVGCADEILSEWRSQTGEVPMETGSRRRGVVGEGLLRCTAIEMPWERAGGLN